MMDFLKPQITMNDFWHISTVLHAFWCSRNLLQFLLWQHVSLTTTSVEILYLRRKGHLLSLLQIPNTVHSFWECERCGFLQQGQQCPCPSCRQFLNSENLGWVGWYDCKGGFGVPETLLITWHPVVQRTFTISPTVFWYMIPVGWRMSVSVQYIV